MNYQLIRADLSVSVELVQPDGVQINIDKILNVAIRTFLIVFHNSYIFLEHQTTVINLERKIDII